MTHSNVNDGFTLIEVLLALSLASLVLIPLLTLQGNNAEYVSLFAQRLSRIWHMERFLYIKQFDDHDETQPEEVIRQEIDDPPTTLMYERTALPDTSSLHGMDGLYREQITARWDSDTEQAEETLIRFVFIPHKGEQ